MILLCEMCFLHHCNIDGGLLLKKNLFIFLQKFYPLKFMPWTSKDHAFRRLAMQLSFVFHGRGKNHMDLEQHECV